MKRIHLTVIMLISLVSLGFSPPEIPVWHPDYTTKYTATYDSKGPEEKNLGDIQCPIPMKDRVRNYTGIQCVYSSLEMLGRWAEEPKLMNPPLTSRKECKGYSSPIRASQVLRSLGVKFENVSGNRAAGIRLIKKAMAERRGALFGVPGHAMVLVHYDEKKDVVKWVDNSDRRLRVQTMTVRRFKQRWDSWVMVIYADNDIIPAKFGNLANKIPIKDRNNPQGKYPRYYIPMPRK